MTEYPLDPSLELRILEYNMRNCFLCDRTCLLSLCSPCEKFNRPTFGQQALTYWKFELAFLSIMEQKVLKTVFLYLIPALAAIRRYIS